MKKVIFSLPLFFLSLGCAVSYNVGVNGYSSSGQSLQIRQESSIHVVEDSNAPNPLLEKEIGMKIRKLLNKNGYSISTGEADYYLLFNYGMSSGQTVTDTIGIYHYGIYNDYPFSGMYSHNYPTYIPYTTVVYTQWLVLKLIDGNAYRASSKAKPLWIGEAVSAGTNSDLRERINYMLIAAFEHFGQDTGKRVNVPFSEDDDRIKLLMQPWENR